MHIVRETSCTNMSYKPASWEFESPRYEKRDHICFCSKCIVCLIFSRHVKLHIRPRHLSHTHLGHPPQPLGWRWRWRIPRSIFVRMRKGRKKTQSLTKNVNCFRFPHLRWVDGRALRFQQLLHMRAEILLADSFELSTCVFNKCTNRTIWAVVWKGGGSGIYTPEKEYSRQASDVILRRLRG